MSTCAVFFVLFNAIPTPERILQLEAIIANRAPNMISETKENDFGHLIAIEDADLYADVNEDGGLHYLDRARYSPLLGVPSIQGRLYELCPLSRVWDKWSPDGPAVDFVVLMLTLLAQGDVLHVWYGTEKYQEGVTLPAMGRDSVLELLDDFIRLGRK